MVTTDSCPGGRVSIGKKSQSLKFYNLIPQQQDYIAARSQNWRPTYSVVHITKNEFSIITYDAETDTPIDQSYSIVKD